MAAHNKINLLVRRSQETSYLNRLAVWALSIGRWVVIITELVVIIAFIYRFRLDSQKSALIEKIEVQKAQIVASKTFEADFRQTQEELTVVNQAISEFNEYKAVFDELVISLPQDIVITSMTTTKEDAAESPDIVGEISMQGTSQNEESLSSLISNLRRSEIFSNVQSRRIDLEEDTQQINDELLEFNVTARIIKPT